jgi:hypothetical protein
MLTDDHKMKRMGSALKFLTQYTQEGDEFLDSIVSGAEIWGFHHTPESKQRSFQWRHTHSPDIRIWQDFGSVLTFQTRLTKKKGGSTTVKRARLTGKGSRSTAVLP